jgi:sulfatase maturation enzyme AslB (radical SAM superfamily)
MTEGLLELDHTYVATPRGPLPSAYDLAKVGFFLFGIPKNSFVSIDVSKDCNLRCRHCYFFEQDFIDTELSVEQWIEKLETMKRTSSFKEMPFLHCTWVGGEPLIRKELIERGRKYFRWNTVVTNGTIPLPNWPDVNFYISIDGDEDLHEYIRNKKGIYKRAMQNVRTNPQLSTTIAFCITQQNKHCLERVVKDWAEAGAKHITFDFYTPIETIDEPMFVPLQERDRLIDKLLALREIYRDFFVIPERTFRLMKSDQCKVVTDNCLFAQKSTSFGPTGAVKEKCMMGPRADCDRCGCVVPFYLWSLTDRRFIAQDVARELTQAAQQAAKGVLTAVVG